MKTRIVQKISSLVLAFVMAFSLGIPALAAESSNANAVKETGSQSEVTIQKISDTSVLVKSNGISELVTVVEDDSTRTVTIQNTKTGEKNYLRYNKLANTIFSSITGKTIDLNYSNNSGIISSKVKTSYSYKYISYAELKDTISGAVTAGTIVAAILAFIPEAQIVSKAVTAIDAVLAGLNYKLPDESNHGLRLTVRTKYYYRTRAGQRAIYKIDHTVTSVATY